MSERDMMDAFRRRFFPTADDLDPNRRLLGLDRVRIQPDAIGLPPDMVNQWTGHSMQHDIIEEKEKWLAERTAPPQGCPKCHHPLRGGVCQNLGCEAYIERCSLNPGAY